VLAHQSSQRIAAHDVTNKVDFCESDVYTIEE